MKPKKYILTGGPGVGKSTLLKLLGKQGVYTIAEVATYIIERESEIDSEILPWKNKAAFQKAVLEQQINWEATPERLNQETTRVLRNGKYQRVKTREQDIETIVQDRGIPDGIAYYLIDGLEAPAELLEAAKKADYTGIFILDPVPYKNTTTRREEPELAKRIHEKIRQVYESLGYKPITIPSTSPEKRAELILSYVRNENISEHPKNPVKGFYDITENQKIKHIRE